MNSIRRHLSYANIIATLALLFTMSGGALAASHYLINSSKQINPKVLRQLSGRTGPSGAAGATGDADKTGASGATGASGPAGPEGVRGNPGSAAAFAYVRADGKVVRKGGAIDITVDRIKTGEYCLIFTPGQELFAPILATLQGEDSTAGLISVNSSVGSDCNPDGGFGVFTKNVSGVATNHDFVVALMEARQPGPA